MNSKLLFCLTLVLSGVCHAAIVYPKAPNGGQQIVCKFADFFAQKRLPPCNGLSVEDLTFAAPYQGYSVGLSNLASGKLLSAAEFPAGGGWQYLIIHGTNAVALAYLEADEKTGKAVKCSGLGSGFVQERLKALRAAEQLPQVKRQDYELRSLDMPWLLFSAFWLHGKSDDIIIPLPDKWGRWNGYQPYSESEMVKLLKPEAKNKLKEPRGMVD